VNLAQPETPPPECRIESLTISMAVYNERDSLRGIVAEALETIDKLAGEGEVLIVDDGSTDGSGGIADEIAAGDKRVRVIHQANQGFSGAIRAGLENARCDVVFQIPADGEVIIEDIARAAPLLANADIVVPYREDVSERNAGRTALSRFAHLVLRTIYRFSLPEISFAYIVKKHVLDTVRPHAGPHTATYAPELIFRAIRQGYSVVGVPFRYRPRKQGRAKGTKLIMMIRTFWDFLRLAPSVYRERRPQ